MMRVVSHIHIIIETMSIIVITVSAIRRRLGVSETNQRRAGNG